MKVVLAVTADFINETADHKLNVIGMFSQIMWVGPETLIPQFYVVAVLEAAVGDFGSEHDVELRLTKPDGQLLLDPYSFHTAVPAAPPAGRLQLNQPVSLTSVVFPEPGSYSLEVVIDGQFVHSTPLDLLPQEAEATP